MRAIVRGNQRRGQSPRSPVRDGLGRCRPDRTARPSLIGSHAGSDPGERLSEIQDRHEQPAEHGRGHGLIWTALGARAWNHGSDGGSARARRAALDGGSVRRDGRASEVGGRAASFGLADSAAMMKAGMSSRVIRPGLSWCEGVTGRCRFDGQLPVRLDGGRVPCSLSRGRGAACPGLGVARLCSRACPSGGCSLLPRATPVPFAWWIRASWLIAGIPVPVISHQARIHHDTRRGPPPGVMLAVLWGGWDVRGERRGDHTRTVAPGDHPAGRPGRGRVGTLPTGTGVPGVAGKG
jgi:hypothetical protein